MQTIRTTKYQNNKILQRKLLHCRVYRFSLSLLLQRMNNSEEKEKKNDECKRNPILCTELIEMLSSHSIDNQSNTKYSIGEMNAFVENQVAIEDKLHSLFVCLLV